MLGYRSGYQATTGVNNVLLGTLAGQNITTGSDNIVIGANQAAGGATANNQLNIGGTLYGDLVAKTVGIGVAAPAADLHVAGQSGSATAATIMVSQGPSGRAVTLATAYDAGAGKLEQSNTSGSFAINNAGVSGSGGTVIVRTLGLDRITIDGPTGNVGIGTASPSTTLQVAGTVGATTFSLGQEIVTASCTVPNGGTCTAAATCPAGKALLSGGFSNSWASVQVLTSYPASTTVWNCTFYTVAGGGVSPTCYALCGKVN